MKTFYFSFFFFLFFWKEKKNVFRNGYLNYHFVTPRVESVASKQPIGKGKEMKPFLITY